MVRQDLVDYLRKGLSMGHTLASLREHLLTNNVSVSDIDDAMQTLQAPAQPIVTQTSPPSFTVSSQPATPSSQSVPQQPPKKKTWLIITLILLAALLLLAVLGYYFLLPILMVNVRFDTTMLEETSDSFLESSDIASTAEETTIPCEGTACVEEAFQACTPFHNLMQVMEGLVFDIAILGPQESACAMRVNFAQNPNPAWVGPEMTCLYDNTLPLVDAMQDLTKCTGPLADLLST